MHPIASFATFGLVLALVSGVIVSSALSMDPVFVDGVGEAVYATRGAEYFLTAVGSIIGLAGIAMIAVAVIAKGLQLGRR